jgi:hypothetical protein
MKNIEPYNQADMFRIHCDLLIKFGNRENKKIEKKYNMNKREKKLKDKLAVQLV